MILRRLLLAASAATLLGIAPAPRLSLTPAVVILHAHFGESVRQTITLGNETEAGIQFTMSAEDVIVRNGKRVFVPAGQLPRSIAATAVFFQRSGYIGPHSSSPALFILTVPAQTPIRAVAIYFRNKNVSTAHGTVFVNASLGALVTFVLTNDLSVSAQPVHVHPATASENLKVADVLTNDGSEPVVPEGMAAFIGSNGALAAKVPFEAARLLPGERLRFTAEYGGRLKPGKYRVLCSFQYENRTLTASGQYTAR